MQIQVNCIDKDLNTYPPLFLAELEQALILIKDDYAALEVMRIRLHGLKSKVETMQSKLKYGYLKRNVNACEGV